MPAMAGCQSDLCLVSGEPEIHPGVLIRGYSHSGSGGQRPTHCDQAFHPSMGRFAT